MSEKILKFTSDCGHHCDLNNPQGLKAEVWKSNVDYFGQKHHTTKTRIDLLEQQQAQLIRQLDKEKYQAKQQLRDKLVCQMIVNLIEQNKQIVLCLNCNKPIEDIVDVSTVTVCPECANGMDSCPLLLNVTEATLAKNGERIKCIKAYRARTGQLLKDSAEAHDKYKESID